MGLSTLFTLIVELNSVQRDNGTSSHEFGFVSISMSCSSYDFLIRKNLEKCFKFFLMYTLLLKFQTFKILILFSH
jgi:hypothetical protein